MLLCWSAKGGSGTTVVTAALSLVRAHAHSTTIADLCGDVPAVLGLPEPSGPGLTDWLASPDADVNALERLAVDVHEGVRLLPRGAAPMPPVPRWAELAAALHVVDAEVVIDAGTGEPPEDLALWADQSLLVTRPCYLALRRLLALHARPTGIVLVREPNRHLRAADVEHCVGVPVVAEVPFDPQVWQRVDAGLLSGRLPRSLSTPLAGVA